MLGTFTNVAVLEKKRKHIQYYRTQFVSLEFCSWLNNVSDFVQILYSVNGGYAVSSKRAQWALFFLRLRLHSVKTMKTRSFWKNKKFKNTEQQTYCKRIALYIVQYLSQIMHAAYDTRVSGVGGIQVGDGSQATGGGGTCWMASWCVCRL